MKHFNYLLFALLFISIINVNAQEKKKFKIHTVAFYNLENLFDTINDPTKNDEASPMMEIKANRQDIYKKKVHNMARVISEIGSDFTRNSPAIIGVCEIENVNVLEDVVNDPLLLGKDYGIVHFNSPDNRGIDVALLYQKKLFQVTSRSTHTLKIYDDETRKRINTRDQLLVSGELEGEKMHFIVNHWPSRRGGEARSRPKRVAAAKLNKRIIDSLQSIDPYAKIITMGDLNDDPTNASVKDVLKAERNKKKVDFKGIYNPYIDMFKKEGLGTTAYRDAWSLFDQIMLTEPFLKKDYTNWTYYRAGIFNENYLVNKKGRWEGYPLRSFADGGFTNGFSDHFPVYVYLIKELEDKKNNDK
ncbi:MULTISPECIES: endonuclease/exonuclease/phosphatase family protein [Mesoflavibacter]|uniref:endonuclease/exonuclease/phosphatase family protein n=1 Tax=Mesoflavibacter TaxID=444051 RepID=UPI001CA88562|nr:MULTISPECIES: endonuclease/exonuclease/phosphatase family protein [Mesoflavibacter]UAB76633.1 endonuclease/exonuclease/phosphatase family protein [Mesoflavibacter sp. SCSIO 43206]